MKSTEFREILPCLNTKDVVMTAFEIDGPSLLKDLDKNEKLCVVRMKHQWGFTRLSLIKNEVFLGISVVLFHIS